MKIGLAVPQIGPLADPDAIREVAVTAEGRGYASLWAMDRLLAPVHPRTPYPASPDGVLPVEQRGVLDPIGVLTLAAASTSRLRVGTNVLVGPWYPAVLLARSLTTLDRISAGRLTVGLGLGWSRDEYDAVGVPQRDLAARSEELLDVLDATWGTNPVCHRGERFVIEPSYVDVKPVQSPRPPLLLAAYTPAGLERVARRADGWTPAGLPVDAVGPMWAAVREFAAAAGRDSESLSLVVRANVKVAAKPMGADRPSFWGSIEQVAHDLESTRATGADEVILDLHGSATTAGELLDVAASILDLTATSAAA